MRHHGFLVAAAFLTLGLFASLESARAQGPSQDSASRITVVCTVGMLADLARGVAGDRATVSSLMGPGIDPHLYKPTRSDLSRLLKADLIIANGLHLEGRMDDTLDRAAEAGRTVIRVGELVPKTQLIENAEENATDPHLWMNTRIWASTVPSIAAALTKVDPAGKETYAANAARLQKDLLTLDEWSAARIATVPKSTRILVTAHDAFEYFGRRFGFEVVGIQGISTESEAGVRDLARIVDLLVSRNVPAVFIESTVPPRHVEALVAGARARGHEVRIGGELFSDAMGDAGTYEGTYPGMIDHNVTTIVRALGGEAPVRGRVGRLSETDAK
jgi:manganese/zinc/iron transport system substrate-binding protein